MSTRSKPSAENAAAAAETGQLGRYQLIQRLASGGMASVYLARAAGPAGFEKVVALKRIHPHLADDQTFVDMFLDEARIASRIDHANVCSVFDFGEADGAYYIAMEFLAGEPFSHVAKAMGGSAAHLKDPRRAHFVAKMVADACEGLHAAHELRSRDGELLNVVHRDISPQNLFLTHDGVVKVVDFGIASAADRLHHTQGAEVKGKFSYMAPEQARGAKGAALDRRADVFALGIVLWELLALKRLFRRDSSAETLMALIHDPIPAPSSQRPGLIADFDAIALKALARNPDERYPSAREVGRELGKAIGKAGEVIGAVDLAEWLETLLPDARTLSRRQIDAALQGAAQPFPIGPPGEVSSSEIVVVEASIVQPLSSAGLAHGDDTDDAATRARSSLSGTPTPRGSQPRVPPPPPRRANSKALYVGGTLALLLGFGSVAAVLLVGRGARDGAAPVEPSLAVAPAAARATNAGTPAPSAEPTVVAPIVAAAPATAPVDPPRVPDEPAPAATPPPIGSPVPHARTSRGPRSARTDGASDAPAVAAPAGGEGTLIVSTPGGWANVYNRSGRLLGQTPLRVQLPAGEQALSLRPFGQPPAISVNVSIPAGGTARVNRPLEE
jgi:serine/threonine-protein kinase